MSDDISINKHKERVTLVVKDSNNQKLILVNMAL